MTYREQHIKEAEKLLDGAREEARTVFAAVGESLAAEGGGSTEYTKAQSLSLRRAQFAIDAAHVHAELALVTAHDPAVGAVGGYA